jgi:hypothetical protein
MTDQRRFEDHALQRIASVSNSNQQERRLAVELLEARDALTRIGELHHEFERSQDWKNCAARMTDIAQFATLPER